MKFTIALGVLYIVDLAWAQCGEQKEECHNMDPCLSVKKEFDYEAFLGRWIQVGIYKNSFGADQSKESCWYKEFNRSKKVDDYYENIVGSYTNGYSMNTGMTIFKPSLTSSDGIIYNSLIRPKGGLKFIMTEYVLETDYNATAIIFSCLCNHLYQLKIYARYPSLNGIPNKGNKKRQIYQWLKNNNITKNEVMIYDASKLC